MKKYISFTLFIAILISSCKKSLVEEPEKHSESAQFFNSDAEAVSAVNGAYSTCYFLYGSGTTYDLGYWSSHGTDIAVPTSGAYNFNVYTLSSSNEGNLDDIWINLYKGVANCNMVISGIKDNKKISTAVGKNVLGQALFLRSLYYYWLTCYWGDVPVWTDALDIDVVGGAIPRTAVSEVRKQMIADLRTAVENLPASWTGTDLGRASKWAANMLL